MSKLEHDTLKSLAKLHNTGERTRVVLPDLPKMRRLAKDPDKSWNDDWDEWNRQVVERKVDALYALAKERDADVNELAKVEDLLLELVPPDMRGAKGKDCYRILLLVALKSRRCESLTKACEMVPIDPKTFRRCRDSNPVGWKISRHAVKVLSESRIREMAEIPPEA